MKTKEALEKYKCKPMWSVIIDQNKHQCYIIDELEHDYGKWNHEDPRLWVDLKGELVPYQRSLQRVCWEIKIKQSNRSKFKWDEISFRSGISVDMIANDKPVYQFYTTDMNYALARSQTLMVELMEHPYSFLVPESENGRKIWYSGLPATIKKAGRPGEIKIIPDTSDISLDEWKTRFVTRKRETYKERSFDWSMVKEDVDDMMGDNGEFLHGDALSDGDINWFRD